MYSVKISRNQQVNNLIYWLPLSRPSIRLPLPRPYLHLFGHHRTSSPTYLHLHLHPSRYIDELSFTSRLVLWAVTTVVVSSAPTARFVLQNHDTVHEPGRRHCGGADDYGMIISCAVSSAARFPDHPHRARLSIHTLELVKAKTSPYFERRPAILIDVFAQSTASQCPRKVRNELVTTVDQDSILNIFVDCTNDEFTHDGQLWIMKEEILQWIFHEEIQARHICVYEKIAEVPIGFNEDRQQEQRILMKERVAWQARYIADAMKSAKKNQVFFAPYNAKRHWMLCVVHPFKEIAYWLDPLGMKVRDDFKFMIEMYVMKMWIVENNLNRLKKSLKWIEIKCPRQSNNTDCGYCVLRYILDIMRNEQDCNHEECFSNLLGWKLLSKDKIDDVRDQWITFMQRFLL
ncbi:hypothetical protein V2J09_008906 [Rumex salicifolius]